MTSVFSNSSESSMLEKIDSVYSQSLGSVYTKENIGVYCFGGIGIKDRLDSNVYLLQMKRKDKES
jgi:hypothetical protein